MANTPKIRQTNYAIFGLFIFVNAFVWFLWGLLIIPKWLIEVPGAIAILFG